MMSIRYFQSVLDIKGGFLVAGRIGRSYIKPQDYSVYTEEFRMEIRGHVITLEYRYLR